MAITVTRDQAKDFLDAHLEGLHDGAPREGCEMCEDMRRNFTCDDCYRTDGTHDPEVEH